MEQDDVFSRLCAEIDLILNSPYPVALKTLNDILHLDEDGNQLRFFAASNPCKVQRLVKEVHDAIPLWPYVLEILQQLCAEPAFRQSILEQYSSLLDTLLYKAVNTSFESQGSQQYRAICLQLLCEPLPKSVSLPASAQKFFVSMVNEAIHSPSASSLCSVHDLLTGACRGLPELLPRDDWARLSHELTRIVKNGKGLQDQSVSLICLGVIHGLDHSYLASHDALHVSSVRCEFTTDAARDFFAGGKAFKSLSLAALQAAWSCKPNVGLSFNEVLRSLEIALSIFLVVDGKIRNEWRKTKEGQGAISYLMKQAMGENLDIELQLRVFAILGGAVDAEQLPADVISKANTVLLNFKYRGPGLRRASNLMALFLEAFGQHISSQSWTTKLREMLELATCATRRVPAYEIQNMFLLSQAIQFSLNQRPSVRNTLASALSALKDDFFSQKFLDEKLTAAHCGTDEYCNSASMEARRVLGSSIASLYLRVALSGRSEDNAELTKVSLRMLAKLNQLSECKFLCNAPLLSRPALYTSLFEAKCTPESQSREQGWKARLSTYVDMDAKHRENSLVRLVGEICHDLEKRCATAEEPYHLEQHRAKELEGNVDRLEDEVKTLKKRRDDLVRGQDQLKLVIESLETKKTAIEDSLRDEQKETEKLFSQVEILEQILREAREDAQDKLRCFQEEANRKEFELRASLGSYQCAMEDLEVELQESRDATEALQANRDAVRAELTGLESKCIALSEELSQSQAQLEKESMLKAQLQTDMQTNEIMNKRLQTELINLREKHQDLIVESGHHRVTYEADIQQVKQHIDTLTGTHTLAIAEMSAKAIQRVASHNIKLNGLTAELDSVRARNEELLHKAETHESTIADHQQKILQLEDLIREKEDQIQGFQQMRQTLAAAISGTNMPGRKHTRKSVHYNEEQAKPQRTPVAQRTSRWLASNPRPQSSQRLFAEDSVSPDVPPDADRSFESASSKSGPTPKRAKQYKPFKAPVIRQLQLSSGMKKTAKSQNMRVPLLDVSGGRGNSSPVRSIVSKKGLNGKGFDEENVYEEFGSEIFTSTPFTPEPIDMGNGNDIDDDTTLDE